MTRKVPIIDHTNDIHFLLNQEDLKKITILGNRSTGSIVEGLGVEEAYRCFWQ